MVPRHLLGGAASNPLPFVAFPARARFHRRNELEPGRQGGGVGGTTQRDGAVLERLAQAGEHRPGEFGQLVEEQHSAVGPRHLAGLRHLACATEHRHCGSRVVRCTKRALGVSVRYWQQCRQAHREHRLPASGRADHQDVVTTGRRDLQGAARSHLAPYVSQIEIVGATRAHAHRGGPSNWVHRLTSFGCVAAGNLLRIVIGPLLWGPLPRYCCATSVCRCRRRGAGGPTGMRRRACAGCAAGRESVRRCCVGPTACGRSRARSANETVSPSPVLKSSMGCAWAAARSRARSSEVSFPRLHGRRSAVVPCPHGLVDLGLRPSSSVPTSCVSRGHDKTEQTGDLNTAPKGACMRS